jgi:energy-coupling factor transporter ATP-binding protein EcfA2
MYEIRRKKLIIKDLEKKIADSLRIVGLSTDLLIRNVYTLSSSEQKLLQIGISLISNPDILILDEPFISLDMKNEKKVIMLLQKIKEQYNKTIIIISNNSDILYKYTNNIIIIKNNKILIEGLTNEVFQRVDFLKRNKIQIPEIVEITYLAKKNKNIKIDYHKDIRDIIKDIYKHV